MGTTSEEKVFSILSRLGFLLDIAVDQTDVQLSESVVDEAQSILGTLKRSAEFVGIFLSEPEIRFRSELTGFIREEFPIIVAKPDGAIFLLERLHRNGVLATVYDQTTLTLKLSSSQLRDLITESPKNRFVVCKRQFECDAISSSVSEWGNHHEHLSPMQRFSGLLRLDFRDIWTVCLFALVAGVLTLATPLAVESLVNVVSWGVYLQPLIVLGLILFVCLGLAGMLEVLQTIVVEIIQRRQFVRFVGDLAHRFPRAKGHALEGIYRREFANRFFDVMTIQKASAKILLDGLSIVLTTVLGMALLGFYHPFLLGFDVLLLICMISIIWLLGRGGISTAIEESVQKYRVAHWLQDVIDSPIAFKHSEGERLAVNRANQLTAEYILSRQRQFAVIIRQVVSSVALYVLASTILLTLGGWLVIDGQLTLGQLVASELIVTVVVGAFVKGGKVIETFYDLMAGLDKVGHLLDMPTDSLNEVHQPGTGPAEVRWSQLNFSTPTLESQVPAATIKRGSMVAVEGSDSDGRALLMRCLGGLIDAKSGDIFIENHSLSDVTINAPNPWVRLASRNDLFYGTIRENVELGRSGVGLQKVRDTLSQVGLEDVILKFPEGVQTQIQTQGYPLTELQSRRVVLARAIVAEPKLLLIDCLLDDFTGEALSHIWKTLSHDNRPWTLIINTNRSDIKEMCESQIKIELPQTF